MNQGLKHVTMRALFAFMIVIGIILFIYPTFADTVDSMLDIGVMVNSKMKSLASGTTMQYWDKSYEIKEIHMAQSLPDDFVPSAANTVSTPDSKYPVYIFFDNTDGAGIIYFFTENDTVVMNPDSDLLFAYCPALVKIPGVVHWDSSNVTDMYGLFFEDRSLADALALRKWDTSNVVNMRYMFYRASSLMFVNVSDWNTSNVKSMDCMFAVGDDWAGNGQLREIFGLENLDVSNVISMTCMFYGAGHITYYDIGGWDVSNVTSMNHMFCDNRELKSLDLSRWDVSNVRTMFDMFDDNESLTTIGDVSHWNTSNLVDAGGWLNGAHSFIGDDTGTLDLSGWDTSNIKSFGEMFYYTEIRTLDLTGWTFDSVTNDPWEGAGTGMYYQTGNDSENFRGFGAMFKDASKLKTIYVSQAGLDSFNEAVKNGINTEHMWDYVPAGGFTVK